MTGIDKAAVDRHFATGMQAATQSGRMHALAPMGRLLSGIAFGSLIMHAAAASAQTPQAVTDEEVAEIVVTGTLLRGVAPVGTNVVSISRQEIIATGGTSANEILTKTPQVTSAFLGTPTTALDGGLSIIRPNIRGLGASGTSTTLVIVDGHRVVGAGALQSTPDPDVIPPGVLESVDIVPDGGSSIYGSDAIGGVINYISRRRFDGFEINARTGFADDYRTTDVNATAGKDWGSGSGYISYSWSHNDAIFGKDRDYLRQITPNSGYCGAGTIIANGTTYEITDPDPDNLTPGTISNCDTTDEVSLWPRSTRHNIFGSLTQDITDSIALDVRGYYARRALDLFPGLDARDLTITAANPFFDSIAGETSQTVRTNFLGIIDQRNRNRLTSYGITPTITARLGGDWQLRAMANLGWSSTRNSNATVDSTTAQTTLNPYDLESNTQSALAAATRHNFANSKQKLVNFRAIADGPIFQLPGGDVRLAGGAEYVKETHRLHRSISPVAFGAEGSQPVDSSQRNVKSVFGEVVIPVVGAGNAMPGVHSLTFTASGRYDDYSDVGGTFNPKLGLTYEPLEWIKIRGNWGKSFNAPSLVDTTGVQAGGAFFSFVFPFGQTAPGVLVIAGNSGGDMKPQTATTWSLGADIQPPAIPGLKLSATYYNINLKKVIGLLAGQPFSSELQPFFRDNVPCAEAAAEWADIDEFPPLIPVALTCLVAPTVAILDWRVQNLGQIKTDGIDFNVSYSRSVGFGAIHASVAGTYTLNKERALVPGASFVELLDSPGQSRLALVVTAGAQVGNLSASASLNHRGGYSIDPVVAPNPANPFPDGQDHVGSFTTVDLFFEYKLPKTWFSNDTSLSLNVTNLFDQDPPFYSGGCFGPASCGFTNGSTLGRLVQIGVRTKF